MISLVNLLGTMGKEFVAISCNNKIIYSGNAAYSLTNPKRWGGLKVINIKIPHDETTATIIEVTHI